MERLIGKHTKKLLPFFEQAAEVAKTATCLRAKCGTVIVKDERVIGSGSNGPAKGLESNRFCNTERDLTIKPKYDKTCCIHAEWRAIINACKENGDAIEGATLYFMRLDEEGSFTDAGVPYCTVCSRLALESGVAYFALWNNDGVDLYEASEYDRMSYEYYIVDGSA